MPVVLLAYLCDILELHKHRRSLYLNLLSDNYLQPSIIPVLEELDHQIALIEQQIEEEI